MYRIDVKTGQYENLGPSKKVRPAKQMLRLRNADRSVQQRPISSEFGGTSIGVRDAKTGIATIYQTPIKNSQ